MTNEEKARELSVNYKVTLNDVQEDFQEQIVEQACMRMALWKEKQMIEKAAKWLLNNATDHLGFDPISESFSLSWDFIDLFKQAMEEDL